MKLFSVNELNKYIKGLFENDPLLLNLWVRGEISNYKQAASGHIYFTLKDDSSSIRVVMFRSRGRLLSFIPDNGLSVRVKGYVTIFERDGAYQLYAEEMEPDGMGALYVAYEQLKNKLFREGLFDQEKKKKLPYMPQRIGIVTSPTGAVIRDMVEIIRRRCPGTGIVLVPVSVQGETAPDEISRGVRQLNEFKGVDLIIVGRGGGSLEELWAFNTEVVARSIFESSIPVISAVGHETDFTIADLVADLRAPTPSAAAELAVPVQHEIDSYIKGVRERLSRAMEGLITRYRRRVESYLDRPVFQRPVEHICGDRGQAVDRANRRLAMGIKGMIERERSRLAVHTGRLDALSPLATLSRGYSICTFPGDNVVIRDAGQVAPGVRVEVKLYNGTLGCLVQSSEVK